MAVGLFTCLDSRCSDDRTSVDDLVVTFENTNTDLIEVDFTEGQIRVRLIRRGESGIAEVTTTVTDSAGNLLVRGVNFHNSKRQ